MLLEMMSSQKLQDLFYMVLMAGNFLNSVSYNSFLYNYDMHRSFYYYYFDICKYYKQWNDKVRNNFILYNKVDIYIIDFGTKTFWINHLNHIEDIDIKSDRQAYQNRFILWLDIQSIFIHQFWSVFVCWKNVKQQKPTHWYVILTLVYQIDWIFRTNNRKIDFYIKELHLSLSQCHTQKKIMSLIVHLLSFFLYTN